MPSLSLGPSYSSLVDTVVLIRTLLPHVKSLTQAPTAGLKRPPSSNRDMVYLHVQQTLTLSMHSEGKVVEKVLLTLLKSFATLLAHGRH